MSRADAVDVPVATEAPPGPSIGGALRAAFGDFYFNSWRLVPANLVWGVGLIALYAMLLTAPLLALLAAPLLALPTLGLYRLAALAVRGEPVALSDAFDAWRPFGLPALGLGIVAVLTFTVFATNVVIGIASGTMLGWALATLAGWGLLVMGVVLMASWPLLVDPWRSDLSVRRRLRLAVLLALAHPVRLGALAVVVAVLLVVSTVAFAAIVMVSVAYVALVTSRYLLPAADRLEARLDRIVRRPADIES